MGIRGGTAALAQPHTGTRAGYGMESFTGDIWVSSPRDRGQYQPIYSIRDTIRCQWAGSRWRNLPE